MHNFLRKILKVEIKNKIRDNILSNDLINFKCIQKYKTKRRALFLLTLTLTQVLRPSLKTQTRRIPPLPSLNFTNPIRTSYYSCSQCSARVEVSRRDGGRKIIISVNGRDENFLNFGANDSSVFPFCCSFNLSSLGIVLPTVIIGS